MRLRYRTASKNIRSDSTGGCPPLCVLAARTSGSIAAHNSSVNMYRMASVPQSVTESDLNRYPNTTDNVNRA